MSTRNPQHELQAGPDLHHPLPPLSLLLPPAPARPPPSCAASIAGQAIPAKEGTRALTQISTGKAAVKLCNAPCIIKVTSALITIVLKQPLSDSLLKVVCTPSSCKM